MGVLRRNPNLYIPIEFVDSDGTVHTAGDWDTLEAKVTGYRGRRGLASGNPKQEIEAQACSKWSDRCYDATPRSLPETRSELNTRILNWVGNVVAFIHRGFVSAEEAKRRAAICASCPRQTHWQNSCAACRMQVNRVAKELLDGKTLTDQMKNLNGCDVLGEDTRISIWVRQAPAGVAELPENCWRR